MNVKRPYFLLLIGLLMSASHGYAEEATEDSGPAETTVVAVSELPTDDAMNEADTIQTDASEESAANDSNAEASALDVSTLEESTAEASTAEEGADQAKNSEHDLKEKEQPVALSVEELKKKVIELNRDLFILEEDLLFPANTQFAVFLSINTGQFLRLDSVKLKVNDDVVAAHLYTERQLKALHRGGMQRLYTGNLKSGEHEVVAVLDGIGPDNRPYKLASTMMLVKETDLKAVEIRITDESADYQPKVKLVEWE